MEMPEELTCGRAIVDFKRRLFSQAQGTEVPLREPLRQVCIVSSKHAQERTKVPFDHREVPGSGWGVPMSPFAELSIECVRGATQEHMRCSTPNSIA